MKSAVLFSGGKDSCYATYLAGKQGYEISCLISVFSENKESYMFHTPSISKVKTQAKVMEIPLLIKKTKGKKEEELKDLEKIISKAKEKFKVDTIVTGAIASVYQASRIQKICDKLNLKCFNPLWKKNELEYWDELFKNNFEIMIVGLASEGLDEKWLGKIINKESFEELKELKKKFKFHLAFEGGEAETFVTNCPLFKKKIKVIKGEKIWEGNSGRYDIQEIELVGK
ncbi:diphthine--ammonia ligase [Candidatus Pacearchaeota archaeon]|nr:diphthine--ammonia ligase [Candidatus Pacearchaeota archaeon]